MLGLWEKHGHGAYTSADKHRANLCKSLPENCHLLDKWAPPIGLLAPSLCGTIQASSSLTSCYTPILPQGFALQACLNSFFQRTPLGSQPEEFYVRRHSKKIKDENYFKSPTNLRRECGSTLPDERGSGLWITENSRKSDKKSLVPK